MSPWTLGLISVLMASAPDPEPGPGTARDEDCLVCHAGVGEEDAPKVDLARYGGAVHAEQGCVGCHADIDDETIAHEEVDEDLAPVACGGCHEQPSRDYEVSVHADAVADVQREEVPSCVACHGSHAIRSADDPEALTHPTRQARTCGACHGEDRRTAGHLPELEVDLGDRGGQADLVALDEAGRLVAAACSDCHGFHDVRSVEHAQSRLHPAHVTDTCAGCHPEASEAFAESAHFEVTRKEGFSWVRSPAGGTPVEDERTAHPERPPVCVSCHPMHDAAPPGTDRFRVDLAGDCGSCHGALATRYAQSYHGAATLLGAAAPAKCSDCHGAHGIRGPDDPESPVAPGNKLAMCRGCHEDAPAGYASFAPHPDPRDPERSVVLFGLETLMSGLLASVLLFFGLHTALWGIREGIASLRRDGPAPRAPTSATPRFAPVDRALYLAVAISFLGLAATGAPLAFAAAAWAPAALGAMGGVAGAGGWHRAFAVLTFASLVGHLGRLVYVLWPKYRHRVLLKTLLGPDSPLPRPRDIVDALEHWGWFLGLRPRPVGQGWTYWQRFDYWAVLWSVVVLGGTGLVLWFPTAFTHLVPGWTINAALVVHADKAVLALAFVFGVHFTHVHLHRIGRPEEASPPAGMERSLTLAAWLVGLVFLGLVVQGFLTQPGPAG